jgi:hypothetical protein
MVMFVVKLSYSIDPARDILFMPGGSAPTPAGGCAPHPAIFAAFLSLKIYKIVLLNRFNFLSFLFLLKSQNFSLYKYFYN